MSMLVRTIAALAIAAAASVSMGAQWPSYPTPGVPRTPDGKPVLDGPTPRTPEGKVDFSGIWELRPAAGRGRGAGAGAGARAVTPPVAPAPAPDAIPQSQFFEVAGRGYALPLQP